MTWQKDVSLAVLVLKTVFCKNFNCTVLWELYCYLYLFNFFYYYNFFIYPLFYQDSRIEMQNLFFQGVLAKMAAQKVSK